MNTPGTPQLPAQTPTCYRHPDRPTYVSCTRCGRPVCPECGHELVLTVGAARPQMGWLLAAVAPGFFSGIAAAFLLIPIVGRLFFGDGRMSLTLNALDLFGWCSGALAVTIAVKRLRFLALPRARQRWCTLIIWSIHGAALAALLAFGPRYM